MKSGEPSYKTKYFEECEEALLKIAVANYGEKVGEELKKEKLKAQKDKAYEITEASRALFEKNLKEQMKEARRRKQNEKWYFQDSKIKQKKMILVASLFFVFLGTVTTTEAFRLNIVNMVMTVFEDYSKFINDENDRVEGANIKMPKEWEGVYYPHYIPEGYRIVESDVSIMKGILYQDEFENRIAYTLDIYSEEAYLDTEEVDYKEVKINNMIGRLYKKENKQAILFHNNEYIFHISSDLEKEELIKVAKSVKRS